MKAIDVRGIDEAGSMAKGWGRTVATILVGLVLQMLLLDDGGAEGMNGCRLTRGEIGTLISLHNKARAEVGVEPLIWSNKLAAYAQSWADHLASTTCTMEHRPVSGPWKQEFGENLLIGAADHHGVADAVWAWEREKAMYHGGVLTASNWYPSGHYTQIVWRTTKRLGCAKAECNSRVIVVCNYDPPGNLLGQKPY